MSQVGMKTRIAVKYLIVCGQKSPDNKPKKKRLQKRYHAIVPCVSLTENMLSKEKDDKPFHGYNPNNTVARWIRYKRSC